MYVSWKPKGGQQGDERAIVPETQAVLVDLSKYFDTLNHELLTKRILGGCGQRDIDAHDYE